MQQNVCQFHVSVYNIEGPHVLDPIDYLLNNDSCLFLFNTLAHFEQDSQVVSIGVFLHHVDIGACFDCLVQSNRMITTYHAVDAYLLMNTVKIILTDICNLDYFACVDFLAWVNSRPHSLLLSACNVLHQV